MRGIYSIMNLKTKVVYIGMSTNINNRINDHKNKLRSGKHANYHLQNSVKKHGLDIFVFSVIERNQTLDTDELLMREKYWIDKFSEFGEVYNIILNPELGNVRGCVSIDLETFDIVKEYDSLAAAGSDITDAKNGYKRVQKCCAGRSQTYKGFMWMYKDEYSREAARERYIKSLHDRNETLYKLDLDTGNVVDIYYGGIAEASLLMGGASIKTIKKKIHECVRGKRYNGSRCLSYRGYSWCYGNKLDARVNLIKNEKVVE
jgi:hypothetical protein